MIAPWISVDDLTDPTSAFAQEAVDAASFVLWNLSARKYGGVRTTTEEYCQTGLSELALEYPIDLAGNGWQVWPVLRNGSLTNMMGGCCSTCGCPHLVRLRAGPVLSVQQVSVGGRVLDPSEIAIYDYSYISVNGGQCWGSCENVTVSYTFGAPPPTMGKIAARALADQYILAMEGSDACDLPARVTQVTRQGMSWTLLDPLTFLDKGLTGLYQVDLFLRAVNPDRARLRARVFSPDIKRGKTKRTSGAGTLLAAPATLMSTYGQTALVSPGGVAVVNQPGMVLTQPQSLAPTSGVQTGVPQMQVETSGAPITVDEGRPLRWVVPGSFGTDSPPTVIVQPGNIEIPPGSLVWRTSNYTVDLSAAEVSELLPPGSALGVRSPTDGRVSSYPVERRTS